MTVDRQSNLDRRPMADHESVSGNGTGDQEPATPRPSEKDRRDGALRGSGASREPLIDLPAFGINLAACHQMRHPILPRPGCQSIITNKRR